MISIASGLLKICTKRLAVFLYTMVALFLFIPAYYFPILTITKLSFVREVSILETILGLFSTTWVFGFLLSLTVILTPVMMAIAAFYIVLFDRCEAKDCFFNQVFFTCKKWMMLDIFSVAIFASSFKLIELVEVEFGVGAIFCILIWMCLTAISIELNEDNYRAKGSNVLSFSFTVAALFLLLPANILPIMNIVEIGMVRNANLLQSVQELLHGPVLPIGIVVFLASFIGPWVKIGIMFVLLGCNNFKTGGEKRKATHEFIEAIGRWSMIDIFIACILVRLVQLKSLASINLMSGSLVFTAMVIFTILASSTYTVRGHGNENT